MKKVTIKVPGLETPISIESYMLTKKQLLLKKIIEAFYNKNILPLARTFGESVIKDLISLKIQSDTIKIISYKNPRRNSSLPYPDGNSFLVDCNIQFGYIAFNTKHLKEGLELSNNNKKDQREYDKRTDKHYETVIRPIFEKLLSIEKKHEKIFKNIAKLISHDSYVGVIGDRSNNTTKAYIVTMIRVPINL
jgi:hypothetical protein